MYNLENYKHLWEKEMFFEVNKIEREHPYDLHYLYITLENISKKYLNDGNMLEGSEFKVPMKDGTHLIFNFYKNSTALGRYIPLKEKKETLLLKDDRQEIEERVLGMLSSQYETSGFGIGDKYPDEFEKLIRNLNVGDVLNFNNGKMYVCAVYNKKFNNIMFWETQIKEKNGNFGGLEEKKEVIININHAQSLQKLYDNNKYLLNSRCELRITSNDEASRWINRIRISLEKGKSKTVDFAGYHLMVQRDDNDNLNWYDRAKKLVDESLVKLYYAYFQTAPVERLFNYERITENKFEQLVFLNELENMYKQHDFAKAADFIQRHCENHHDGFMYQERSYVLKTDNAFTPKTFVFFYKNGYTNVMELEYKGNDYDKLLNEIKPSTMKDFISFCEKKYSERYSLLLTRCEEKIRTIFPKADKKASNTKMFDIIVEQEAKKATEISLFNNPLIKKEDIQKIDDAIMDLLRDMVPENALEIKNIKHEEEGIEL